MAGLLQQLSGNPLSTSIGQKIEQATEGSLGAEDWALNMEICDMINDTDEGPRDAVRALKKRMQQNAGKNHTAIMYTLTVLETCVKNCGKRFHLHVTNKDFIQDMVKLIGPKNDPPAAVQEKVLSLIQTWAEAFRNQPELQGVVTVYNELKTKGIEFPMTDLDAMVPIHTPQRSVPLSQLQAQAQSQLQAQAQAQSQVQSPAQAQAQAQVQTQPVNQNQTPALPQVLRSQSPPAAGQQTINRQAVNSQAPRAVMPTGPVKLSSEQLAKLRSELDVVQGNMRVFNDMLNEMTPGKEHNEDWELLRDLNGTCQGMQKRLVELIEKVANEEVTNELLRVNDELNNLFVRYERFLKKKTQTGPVKHEKPDEPSLIDLNDENAAAQTDPGMAVLTNRMSDVNITTGAVGGAMAAPPPPAAAVGGDVDFDMFAQSRSTTYEKSKGNGSSYADNANPDQVEVSLGSLTQDKAQRDVTREPKDAKVETEQDFDEMERWLKEQPVNQPQQPTSIPGSEFDRFLAERANAAERLPSQPQPQKQPDPFGL